MDLKQLTTPWNWFRNEQSGQHHIVPRGSSTGPQGSDPTTSLQRQFQQWFDEMARQMNMPALARDGAFRPDLDIKESPEEYTIHADMPGMKKDDVRVELRNDTLVIQGERRQEKESDDDNYHFVERHFGTFQRLLDMPADADPETLKAEFKDGVLTVHIGRKKDSESQPKRIDIH